MAHPFLIVCGAVAAVMLILVTASMFGVSRRAVEAEMRRAADHGEADADARPRRDDLAA
jgi:hypothetical protein